MVKGVLRNFIKFTGELTLKLGISENFRGKRKEKVFRSKGLLIFYVKVFQTFFQKHV